VNFRDNALSSAVAAGKEHVAAGVAQWPTHILRKWNGVDDNSGQCNTCDTAESINCGTDNCLGLHGWDNLAVGQALPNELSGCKIEGGELVEIDFTGLEIGVTMPNSFEGCTSLKSLKLAFTKVTSGGFPNIGGLTNLETLNVFGNQWCSGLSCTLPSELSALTNLKDLNIGNSRIDGDPAIGLQGQIPDIFTGMTDLQNIEFQINHFSGTIPPSMATLTSLQKLYLSLNDLTGTVPDFSACNNLKVLYIGAAGNVYSNKAEWGKNRALWPGGASPTCCTGYPCSGSPLEAVIIDDSGQRLYTNTAADIDQEKTIPTNKNDAACAPTSTCDDDAYNNHPTCAP